MTNHPTNTPPTDLDNPQAGTAGGDLVDEALPTEVSADDPALDGSEPVAEAGSREWRESDRLAAPQTGRRSTDVPDLAPADVAAYLRRHPDFLKERPDLIAVLTPPEREMGTGVVDMQRFMVERLRGDVQKLKLAQRKLIATSRNNMASQSKVHAAVLAMLGARTFEHLIGVITDELTLLLDIDAVGLCIEATHGAALTLPSGGGIGVQVLEPGAVDDLLGPGRDVLLRADVAGDPALFGEGAGLVRSDALVRLRVSSEAPMGLLAMGARRPGTFHPGQGTELIGFMIQVIEHTIRAWLDLAE